MASKNGHEHVVSVLLERGADVKITDVEGNNCLDIAIEFGQKLVRITSHVHAIFDNIPIVYRL